MRYKNGNADVWLDLRDGTRVVEYPDNEPLTLETPLNIDIRVSTQCPYGYDANTKQSTCAFCHESALVNGQECDYQALLQVLKDARLPRGTEIALGVNEITDGIIRFIMRLYFMGLIVNVTMNERYILEYGDTGIRRLLPYIFGLGISYRSLQGCLSLPDWIAEYPHTVIHVINGIDDFDDVKELSVKYHKLLVLGEKDFGLPQNRERVYIIGHLGNGCTEDILYRPNQSEQSIVQVGNIIHTTSFGGNPQRGRIYSPHGLSPTLTCVKGGGIEPKILLSRNPNVIRKLTPREFWRLQGFTDSQFDTCAKIQSNAQLYKQAGNSVSIPIVYELGKKIIEHHRRLHGNE